MKRLLSILTAGAALLLPLGGCRPVAEEDVAVEEPARRALRFGTVPVSLDGGSGDSTKSVVSTDVEGFRSAYLFAFAPEGGVYLDGEERPVAIHTDSKTFDWTLPLGVEMDIRVVVNPGEGLQGSLEGFLSDPGLTRAGLEGLSYSCASASEMLSMETGGMPMSGSMDGVILESGSDPLTFTLRRLYARFDLKINTSRFASAGWSVSAAQILASRSNTEAPFFYGGDGVGFRQEDPSKLKLVDLATSEDLEAVNTFGDDGRSTMAATLYFLENCQGDPTGTASRWSNVGTELADEVANCSYIEFSVTASRTGFGERAFKYRLYPGQNADMKSNFDIIRNRQHKINITLDAPTDGFQWTNTSTLRVAPGETITIPFETSLMQSEASFSVDEEGVSTSDLAVVGVTWRSDNLSRTEGTGSGQRQTSYNYYGTVSFKANDAADEGTIVTVQGGQAELFERANVLVMTDFDFSWTTVSKSTDYYPETQTIEWTSSKVFTSSSADYIISHSTCQPNGAAHGSPVTLTKEEIGAIPSYVAKRWRIRASMLPWWPGANGFTLLIQSSPTATPDKIISSPTVTVMTPKVTITDPHADNGLVQDVYVNAAGSTTDYSLVLSYPSSNPPSAFPAGCSFYSEPDLAQEHDLEAFLRDGDEFATALQNPGYRFDIHLRTTSFRGMDFDPRWEECQANLGLWQLGIRYPHGYVLSIGPDMHIKNPMYGKDVPSTPYEYEVHKGRTLQESYVSVRNEDPSDTRTYYVEYLREWPKRLLAVDLSRGGTVTVPSGMTRSFDRGTGFHPDAALSGNELVVKESSFTNSNAMDAGCGLVSVGYELEHLVSGESLTYPHSLVRVYTHFNAFATFDAREDKNVIRESIMSDTFSGTQADGLDDIESWKYNQSGVTLLRRFSAWQITMANVAATLASFGLASPFAVLGSANAWSMLADAPITVIDASLKWNCTGNYQQVEVEKTVPEHILFAHERISHDVSASGDSFVENYWWEDSTEHTYTYTVGWNRGSTRTTYHMVGLEGSRSAGLGASIINLPNWRTVIARNAPAFSVRTGTYGGLKVKKVSEGVYNLLETDKSADPSGNGYAYLHTFWEGKEGRVAVEAYKLSALTDYGPEVTATVGMDFKLTLANGWWDPDVYSDGIPLLLNKVGMYFFPDAPGDTKRAGMYPYYPGEAPWGSDDSTEREESLYSAGSLRLRDTEAPKNMTEYNAAMGEGHIYGSEY